MPNELPELTPLISNQEQQARANQTLEINIAITSILAAGGVAELVKAVRNLSGSLWNIDFTGAILCNADLSEVDFDGANLRQVDFYNSNLSWSEFFGADLSGANLHRTNLRYAKLDRANLQGASLYKANLMGADLRYSNLERTQFGQAMYDKSARFPDGFKPDDHGMIFGSDKLYKIHRKLELLYPNLDLTSVKFNPKAKNPEIIWIKEFATHSNMTLLELLPVVYDSLENDSLTPSKT